MLNTVWKLKEPDKESAAVLRHSGYSKVMAALLSLRGLSTPEKAKSFISCKKELYDPFLLKDIKAAAGRILTAFEKKEKITVYGDYDADGVTSTALMYSYLKDIGANVFYYIPQRLTEGYGLNSERAKKIAEDGTRVVITVDNGISAFDEADFFAGHKVDFIITDHHSPRDIIPNAYAVVNPKQPLCPYPFKELAGVGVAYKVICAIEALRKNAVSEHALFQKYGELVTLGTVADVVPLLSENRYLVSRGLSLLSAQQSVGLEALFEAAGIHGKKITSTLLAFTAAPRINACGRMGSAEDAINLLLSKEPEEAKTLAEKLNANNSLRQDTEAKIFTEAVSKIDGNEALRNNPLLIVSGENWHPGVIGIVASRLVEKYKKPCVVVSFKDDIGRASCRSVEGFNIHKALMSCSQFLERFGGHEMAAGFSVKRENYDALYAALNRIATALPEIPTLKITPEFRLTGREISLSTARQIKQLEPCGNGNPTPLFYVTTAQITSLSPVGKGHSRIELCCDGFNIRAVMFNTKRDGFDFNVGDVVDFTATLDINLYKNSETLNIIIKNMRKSQCYSFYRSLYHDFLANDPIEPPTLRLKLKPDRSELVLCYRAFYSGGSRVNLEDVFKKIFSKDRKFNYFKLLIAIDVFREMGIMIYDIDSESSRITYSLNSDNKVDLKNSSLLKRLG